jgi:hypothetical protein
MQFGWNEFQNRLPYDLGRRISKDAMSAFIPTGDNPVQVLADDRVIRRFDHRRKKASDVFRERVRSC